MSESHVSDAIAAARDRAALRFAKRYSRLPKWAQKHIGRLESDLDLARRRVKFLEDTFQPKCHKCKQFLGLCGCVATCFPSVPPTIPEVTP